MATWHLCYTRKKKYPRNVVITTCKCNTLAFPETEVCQLSSFDVPCCSFGFQDVGLGGQPRLIDSKCYDGICSLLPGNKKLQGKRCCLSWSSRLCTILVMYFRDMIEDMRVMKTASLKPLFLQFPSMYTRTSRHPCYVGWRGQHASKKVAFSMFVRLIPAKKSRCNMHYSYLSLLQAKRKGKTKNDGGSPHKLLRPPIAASLD